MKKFFLMLSALAFAVMCFVSCSGNPQPSNDPEKKNAVATQAQWNAAFDKLISRGSGTPVANGRLLAGKDGEDADAKTFPDATEGFVLKQRVSDAKKSKSVDLFHIVTPNWSVQYTQDKKRFILAASGDPENLPYSESGFSAEYVEYKYGGTFYYAFREGVSEDYPNSPFSSNEWSEWYSSSESDSNHVSTYEGMRRFFDGLKGEYDKAKALGDDKLVLEMFSVYPTEDNPDATGEPVFERPAEGLYVTYNFTLSFNDDGLISGFRLSVDIPSQLRQLIDATEQAGGEMAGEMLDDMESMLEGMEISIDYDTQKLKYSVSADDFDFPNENNTHNGAIGYDMESFSSCGDCETVCDGQGCRTKFCPNGGCGI